MRNHLYSGLPGNLARRRGIEPALTGETDRPHNPDAQRPKQSLADFCSLEKHLSGYQPVHV